VFRDAFTRSGKSPSVDDNYRCSKGLRSNSFTGSLAPRRRRPPRRPRTAYFVSCIWVRSAHGTLPVAGYIPPEELQSHKRQILRSHGSSNGSVVEFENVVGNLLHLTFKWIAPELAKVGVKPGSLLAEASTEGRLLYARYYSPCPKSRSRKLLSLMNRL
jgi:hypothetical protein